MLAVFSVFSVQAGTGFTLEKILARIDQLMDDNRRLSDANWTVGASHLHLSTHTYTHVHSIKRILCSSSKANYHVVSNG